MKAIKGSLKMIRYNLKTLILFELLFKLLSILFFGPLFIHLFDFIMKIRGFQYLTLENMLVFLVHPFTIFLLFILILLMTAYTLFDIITIIAILDFSHQQKKINLINAIRISLEKCKKVLHLKNSGLVILVLFLIPFLNIGISSSFISKITIPEFIQEYIFKNQLLTLCTLGLVFYLIVYLLRSLYAIHYFVLENVNFKEARKKSILLSHNHHFKDWLTLGLVQIIGLLLFLLFMALGLFVILKLQSLTEIILLKSFLTTLLMFFVLFFYLLFILLATPISYAGISSLYYLHKNNTKEKEKNISLELTEKNRRRNNHLKRVLVVFSILSLTIATLFTYGYYTGKYDISFDYERETTITAHRGASKEYPENTMSAFLGAKELGADVIELDVQQTKDNEIIVMHDKNLKRTTGIDKYVWEMTKQEIENLDAGSHLNSAFKEEKVPLLKEVVLWAKENEIKLNIELKPTGKEENFAFSVISILKETSYLDNTVIASQVYPVLEEVKQIDDTIKTVYVASLFYGDILAFPCADDFSIEISSITKNLVESVHKKGKKIYAWTINTEENMQHAIELEVDNIITDHIELAKKVILLNRKSNIIYEYVKWIENNL